MTTRDKIKQRLEDNNVRHWANDNIADYIKEGEKQQLIDEAVPAFENMLQSLLIDTKTDPNSQDTARRMAKMYINEIMSGRYDQMPNPSSFPNYMLVSGFILFKIFATLTADLPPITRPMLKLEFVFN